MRVIARASGLVLAIAVLVPGALAGCGPSSSPAGPTAPPSPSGSAAAPSSPSPSSPSPFSPEPAPAPTATVVSSTVSYPWHWPNDVNQPGRVQHSYPVPPLPRLC